MKIIMRLTIPVHKQRKFSAVLGTTSARNVNSILPILLPAIATSKKTTGLFVCDIFTRK